MKISWNLLVKKYEQPFLLSVASVTDTIFLLPLGNISFKSDLLIFVCFLHF